jgi:hypothetical protein
VAGAPITQRTRDGDVYYRRPDVEAEIGRVLALEPSEWAPAGLKSETLVHLIRRLLPTEEKTVLGRLLNEITKRMTRIVKSHARGFSRTITEIVEVVRLKAIELVLAAAEQSELVPGVHSTQSRAIGDQSGKRKPLSSVCVGSRRTQEDGSSTDGAHRYRTTPLADGSPLTESSERLSRSLCHAPSQQSATPTTGWRLYCTT